MNMSLGIMIEALISTFDFDICGDNVIEAPFELYYSFFLPINCFRTKEPIFI